jgi:hypothetical protein
MTHKSNTNNPVDFPKLETEMNERIRQLWDKAATASAAFPSGQNNSWETQVNFMEKFAELIVRECSRIGELKEQGSSEYDPNMSVGWYMRKHFGVEE